MLEPIRISACDTTITGTNDTVDYDAEIINSRRSCQE